MTATTPTLGKDRAVELSPAQNANLREVAQSLRTGYPLRDICPACGTGHVLGPCRFGLCRRCDFPIGPDEPKRRLREAFLPYCITVADVPSQPAPVGAGRS